jgi:hypothetical protein
VTRDRVIWINKPGITKEDSQPYSRGSLEERFNTPKIRYGTANVCSSAADPDPNPLVS